MQNTLLGLAIAIILVLAAALAAPFFVDWNQYRALFEAQATRVVGAPVRVNGAIEARILPSPSLRLNGITIGGDRNQLRARALGFEFALGPLMRGEFRASDMHLVGPDFEIGLDQSGRVAGPGIAIGFDADALSIDHLSIEDGRAAISDAASGSRVLLDKMWFNGQVRSLAGPFKGEGSFVSGGELVNYRVSAGRVADDGSLKLKLNIDPSDRPLSLEADGTVSLQERSPRFEGALTVARPAGIALASGQTQLNEPWRATAQVKAQAGSALFEQVEFQYGPEEHNVKLSGTANLAFGARPRFEGVLSAHQIDVDHLLPSTAGQPPIAVLKTLADSFGGGLRPPIPLQLGIGIDAVTLGGATLQSLGGDLRADGDTWSLDGLEFRAPGFAQVKLSGRLDLGRDGLAFAGPVAIDANDPRAFAAWLEGRDEATAPQFSPLHARADVAIGRDKLELADLKAEFEKQSVAGRVSYGWATADHPTRLDANLRAPVLDLDAAWAFAKGAFGATTLERPREIALAVAIDRTTLADVSARQLEARLRLDGNAIQVDRLAIADLGGAAISLSGSIDSLSTAPRGKLSLDLDARDLAGVTALLAKLAPDAAEPIRRAGARLLPAKLHSTVSLDDAAGGTTSAKLGFDGQAGGLRFSIAGQGSGTLATLASADLRLDGKLDTDDGAKLADLLGLGRYVTLDNRPARLSLTAKGPLGGNLRVDGRMTAGGLDAGAGGTLRLLGDAAPVGSLALTVAAADLRSLRRPLAGQAADPLPVALAAALALDGKTLTLGDISGKVAGSAVRGRLSAVLGEPSRINGNLDIDTADASALIAAAVGLPVPAGSRSELGLWSSEPFAPWALPDLTGEIRFKAARAILTPSLVARQAQAVLHFGRSEISLDDVSGTLADGRLASQLTVRTSPNGLAARAHIGLTNADATMLIPGQQRPPIVGRLGLQLDLEGAGLSPMALLGAVNGGGTLTLEGGQLDALSPKAFDTLTRAVDRGMVLDTPRIQDVTAAALAGGRLVMPRLDADVTVADGQIRLGTVIAQGQGADLALVGKFDLAQAMVDARLTLSGPAGPNSSGLRPDVFVTLKGPVGAVKRSLDVSNLAGWLTLRAVEQQASRLEAAEAIRRESALTPDHAAPGPRPGTESVKDPAASVVAIPPVQPEATGALASPGLAPLPNPIEVKPAPVPLEKKPARPAARTAGPLPSAGGRPPIRLRPPVQEPAAAPPPREQFPLNLHNNP